MKKFFCLMILVLFLGILMPKENVMALSYLDEPLVFDVEYTGMAGYHIENDEYLLVIPSDGYITATILRENRSLHLYFYDELGDSVKTIYYSFNEKLLEKEQKFEVPLKAGRYKLYIGGKGVGSNGSKYDSTYFVKLSYNFNSSTDAKVSSPDKKQLKVTAPKGTIIDGFEVRYKIRGDNEWTTKVVETTKNLNETFSGLKSGETYYVQTRKFVSDDYGYQYYSDWTKSQKVKIK